MGTQHEVGSFSPRRVIRVRRNEVPSLPPKSQFLTVWTCSQALPARYSPDAEGTGCSFRADGAADGSGGVTHSASTMSLKLPLHKRRCIFVDSTQQIIAAASGDGSRDRRSKRKRTTSSQLDILVSSFVQSDSPSYETREELASVCLLQ